MSVPPNDTNNKNVVAPSDIGNIRANEGGMIILPLSDSVHNLTLPPYDTDMFEGDYLSWPTFRYLFSAIYINNSRLIDIERLCHPVRKTSGEAQEIVSKFPLTHCSFVLAWKTLRDAYDNTHISGYGQRIVLGFMTSPLITGIPSWFSYVFSDCQT